MMKLTALKLLLGLWAVLACQSVFATCLIFVHGKQTDTNTFTSYNAARNYWVNGSNDFIRTATRNFATPYYVVGYNGTQAYWNTQAAGEVANEIVTATNGSADAGGRRCTQGGPYIVVAHSMGGPVMDFILGNNDASDPNFNLNGPYNTVASRISYVITLSGAHRGSQGADAACGDLNLFCDVIASFIQDCDQATSYLRSADSAQVRTYANAPARTIYLTGGYEAIFGSSACLSGEDDGVVQYASQYACGGSAGTSYNNSNVCGNNNKQEASGFRNLDAAHENHSDIRDASDADTRKTIPNGIWTCGGGTCSANTTIQDNMTTAEFVSLLY